jgi:hypothetical protein
VWVYYLRNIWIFLTGYTIWPGLGQFTLNKTVKIVSNFPYNLIFTIKFNDSSILITIIACHYFNLLLANEYVGDVIIPNTGYQV